MKLTLEKVESKIQEDPQMPTLPSVATKLARMVQTSSVSAPEIGKLISNDVALTAQVLKLVNSSYYGFPKQINHITQAIVIMGFNRVRDVVLTTSVIDSFSGRLKQDDFVAFWEHSIAAAIATDALAKVLKAPSETDAFVGGLLHDIGKLILAAFFPGPFGKVVDKSRKDNLILCDVEQESWDFDHTTVGRILAERWSFSETMTDAISHHHSPGSARRNVDLVSLVHVGDVIARAVLTGSRVDSRIPVIQPAAKKELDLSREVLDHTLAETMQGLRRGRVFFDLIRDSNESAA